MQEIQTKINDTPGTSVRKLMVQTDTPRATAFRALKQLKSHVYHTTLVQELPLPDLAHCLAFCKWFFTIHI